MIVVPMSLFGVPYGTTDACGTAILSSHSASGRVRLNVIVLAFGLITTPLASVQVAGLLRHACPPTSTL